MPYKYYSVFIYSILLVAKYMYLYINNYAVRIFNNIL